MRARRILITGASGFSGDHACRHFAEAGWEVIAIVSPQGAGKLVHGAIHREGCELRDAEAVLRLFRLFEPDAVLHLAGRNAVDSSWREPAATLSVNLMSTVNLLEAARVTGPCRILIVGSMLRGNLDQLTKSAHPYGFSKTLQVAAAEVWHRWFGLQVMIAEPSNLIGPGGGSGLCSKIARWTVAMEEAASANGASDVIGGAEVKEGAGVKGAVGAIGTAGALRPFSLSSLQDARDFLDVRDAVAAYEVLVNEGTPGANYALESGRFRTLGDVKTAFDQASTTTLQWVVQGSAGQSPIPRDTSLIYSLGWKPIHSFQQSIQDVLQDERERRVKERGGLR